MARFWQVRTVSVLFILGLVATACAAPAESDVTEDVSQAATAVPTAQPPTSIPPTNTVSPTETAASASSGQAVPEASPTPEPTATAEPTRTPEPAEPTPLPEPLFPVGSTANWTESNDSLDIEGEIEFTSATELVIRNFVFLAAEAPGVDIRLGVGDDFSDGVGVSLRDITGKTYEGRSLTLTIPAAAFDGRSFDSIGVFCFDTGDLFDYALIQQ